jgi:hypothetical protein
VRSQIPEIYKTRGYEPAKSFAMAYSNLIGLGRGPSAGDPLLADNRAVLLNNGDADILFTNGREDPLVNPLTIDARMTHICAELSKHTTGRVMSAVIDGASHGPHTFYPQYIEKLSQELLG